MSPASFMKVRDPGARFQAPFTLSDTCTCSGTSYCENHPTSRSPWATGLASVTVTVETRDPVENAVPWTKVGALDWATTVRGSRTPRVAITARPAVDRADGKCFTVIHSSAIRAVPPRGQVPCCLVSNRRPGAPSPPPRAASHALWGDAWPHRPVGLACATLVARAGRPLG